VGVGSDVAQRVGKQFAPVEARAAGEQRLAQSHEGGAGGRAQGRNVVEGGEAAKGIGDRLISEAVARAAGVLGALGEAARATLDEDLRGEARNCFERGRETVRTEWEDAVFQVSACVACVIMWLYVR